MPPKKPTAEDAPDSEYDDTQIAVAAAAAAAAQEQQNAAASRASASVAGAGGEENSGSASAAGASAPTDQAQAGGSAEQQPQTQQEEGMPAPPPPPPQDFEQDLAAQEQQQQQGQQQDGQNNSANSDAQATGDAAATSTDAKGDGAPGAGGAAAAGDTTQNIGDDTADISGFDTNNRHIGPNRACTRCRERKLKCDGIRPMCSQCIKVKSMAERKTQKQGKLLDAESLAMLCKYAENPRRRPSARKRKEPADPSQSPAATKRGRKSMNLPAGDASATGNNEHALNELATVATYQQGRNTAGRASNAFSREPAAAGSLGAISRRNFANGLSAASSGGAAGQLDDPNASAVGGQQQSYLRFDDVFEDGAAGSQGLAAGGARFQIHANGTTKQLNDTLLDMLPEIGVLHDHVAQFCKSCPFLLVFQPQRLLNRITEGKETDEFPCPALLHAILAWAYTLNPELGKANDERSAQDALNAGYDQSFFAYGTSPGERHAAFAKQALWASFGGWKLDVCIASIIFGQWLYATGRLPDAWVQVGISSRACIPLSLNRSRKTKSNAANDFTNTLQGSAGVAAEELISTVDLADALRLPAPALQAQQPVPQDWVEEEERRRTFWTAFVADRVSAATASWPNGLDERDALVELPASTQTEFSDGNANILLHNTSDQLISDSHFWESEHVDGFRLHLKASILLGRVGTLLARLPTKPDEKDFRAALSASGLSEEIKTFRSSATSFLQNAPKEKSFGDRTMTLSLNALMLAECSALLLAEPLALLDKSAEVEADEVCKKAMEVLARVQGPLVFQMPPVFSWCVGQVGRSLIRKMESSADKDSATIDLKTCLTYLDLYGSRFELGNLHSRALSKLIMASTGETEGGAVPAGSAEAAAAAAAVAGDAVFAAAAAAAAAATSASS